MAFPRVEDARRPSHPTSQSDYFRVLWVFFGRGPGRGQANMLANVSLGAPLALRAVRVWQLCLDFRDGYAIFS
jgi:hypothetical protein